MINIITPCEAKKSQKSTKETTVPLGITHGLRC